MDNVSLARQTVDESEAVYVEREAAGETADANGDNDNEESGTRPVASYPLDCYVRWIAGYRLGQRSTYGRCEKATLAMVRAFPELTRVRGHVETVRYGRRAHWWCTAPDGRVYDPTADQFPMGVIEYEPIAEGSMVRAGRCMQCGDEIWVPCVDPDVAPVPRSTCSARCEQELLEYMNRNNGPVTEEAI